MSDHLTLTSHPAWAQFQTLHNDYRIIFDPGFNPRDTTKPNLRNIMKHFGLEPKYRRSDALKADLCKNYNEQLLPIIQPFIRQTKTTDAIAIDTGEKFEPLDLKSSDTTKRKLCEAITKYAPTASGVSAMRRPQLIALYRTAVLLEKPDTSSDGTSTSPSGSTSVDPRFIAEPPIWTQAQLLDKRRDDIRFALQFHRPKIFIPSTCLKLDICRRIYEKFLLNIRVENDIITEGVHYYVRP